MIHINDRIAYPSIDVSKQIIKRAAYEDQAGKLLLKAARVNNGQIVPLTSVQIAQVISYINRKKFAGTNIELRSVIADRVRLYFDIYYDALLDPAIVRNNIYSAIDNYFASFSGDNFGGIYYQTKLIDAIQEVDGVLDVYPRQNTFFITAEGSSISVGRSFRLYSGYGELDTLGYSPATSIALIPQDNVSI